MIAWHPRLHSAVQLWCGTGRLESRLQKSQVSSFAETAMSHTNNVSLSQPNGYDIYGFSFLNRSSILFPYRTSGQENILRFEVVTFDSESVNTDEAALHVYHFNLDVFGPYSEASDFLSTNTLPSNTPGLCIPGFFHSEPSSRLLALEVRMSDRYFGRPSPAVRTLCAARRTSWLHKVTPIQFPHCRGAVESLGLWECTHLGLTRSQS